MKAIILAAGPGTKQFPYDLTRQKAAIPVANEGLIAWTARQLRRAGVTDLTVVVGHLQERVRHALRREQDVRFVRQGSTPGTAPAVLDALSQIGTREPFIVLYGDCLFSEEDIRRFVQIVKDEKPAAAAGLAPLGGRDAREWICAGMDGDQLAGISGHPRGGSHRLCGLYYFDPTSVPFIRANPGVVDSVNVGGMPKMEAELAQSIQLMIDDGRAVRAIEHTGMFVDIDKPWHVLEANQCLAKHLCERLEEDDIDASATVHDGAEIHGHVMLGPNVRIGNRVVIGGNLIAAPGAQITNGAIVGGSCVVGAGAKIRDYCQVGGATVVGDESLIGHGAELGGVCFEGAFFYHYCEMAGVFGARYDAGAATVCGNLRFDDGDTVHEVCGRKEIPDGGANLAYIGDYTRTGVNAILMPGVKVGAYSCIGPGVILYDDVDHNSLVLAKQELVKRPWGPEKYGW